MTHEPYRLRTTGHCLQHHVRYHPERGTWQHKPPSSDDYLDTSRQNAAFVIQNGGWISPFRRTLHPAPRRERK